ncbi:hemerythrin domain-containing protein [Pseudopedobacter beijingensis]|uniref:Hemerythrin domain-containing protein n=1 Tax=Pseudopedobacter beijingensis TaxID=1207056 RepID=A0ABW4ICS6_9SPHI
MQNKPIKRSNFLIQLSRDHHLSLLFCWKIKEGLKRDISPILKDYVHFFWKGHMLDHFKQEEILLYNNCLDQLCKDAVNQHDIITEIIRQIHQDENPKSSLFQSLIDQVNLHIRFEERQVFPHLEKSLSTAELRLIEKILDKEKDDFTDNYPVEFWKL